MTTTGEVAVPAEHAERRGFWGWLTTLPTHYQLLTGAVAAVTAFLPQTVIPEPLDALRAFGTAVVVVAFLLTWVARTWVRKHVRKIIVATAGLLFVLILVHQVFVKPVRYRTAEGTVTTVETTWFVTGWNVVDPDMAGMTDEDRIRAVSGGWDELHAIWGGSFIVVALTYSLLYLMVINGMILSLGGADFTQPRQRRGRTIK